MERDRGPGRILTFYSYKGGTGRSMALANIAWILACNGLRVLAIDWDLEAPGLHRYFRPFLIDEELSASDGLIDLVDEYANQAIRPLEEGVEPPADWYLEYADLSNYVIGLNFKHFPRGGKIDLLPSGRQSDRYAITVSSFNWQNFYDRLGGGGFFDAVKANARAHYDYVLIDSRTGVSDTAGICSVQMPDSLVVCFTYNNQSIKGAAAVSRSSAAARKRLLDEKTASRGAVHSASRGGSIEDTPSPYRVFPIPMRVDPGESERLAIRRAFAREAFADLVSHVGPSIIDEYWSRVEVPHTPFYSYEEVLSPFKDDANDPKTILAAFVRMTQYLTDGEVSGYSLPISPDEKQKCLDEFAETPLTIRAKRVLAKRREESEEEGLVRNADVALGTLTEAEAVAARRVLGRLVRLGSADEGGGFFPIRARVSDFSEAERPLILKLRDKVVKITSETRYAAPYPLSSGKTEHMIGLADDRLLKQWKTLQQWLEADRPFLLWRQQLRTYLQDWERSGRDAGALLSGRLLSEADLWTLKRGGDLNSGELEYVEASRRGSSSAPGALPAQGESTPPEREILHAAPERQAAPAGRVGAHTGAIAWLSAVAVLVAALSGFLFLLTKAPGPAPEPTPTPISITVPITTKTPVAPADATAKKIEALLAQGDGFAAYGNTVAALEAYSGVLVLDPKNERAFAGLVRAKDADQSATGRVAIHYTDDADASLVYEVWNTLSESLRPIVLDPPRYARQRTMGDVRYFFPEDRKLAERVGAATEFILSKSAVKQPLKPLFRDAKEFPDVRKGTIEVWLPALGTRRDGTRPDGQNSLPAQRRRPSGS